MSAPDQARARLRAKNGARVADRGQWATPGDRGGRVRRLRGALVGLAILGALGPGASQVARGGEIWRGTDEQGNVIFSDQPIPGGKRIVVPPVQTFEALPVPRGSRASPPSPAPGQTAPPYRVLEIASPADGEPVRANNGRVEVRVRLEPELAPGHEILVLLDGVPAGAPARSPLVALENVSRGTHTLTVMVRDGDGRELVRSPPVTFHLLRVHAGGQAG